MTFIIRIEIIAVNNSYRIIQLQTELESKSASRIAFEHPVFFHFHTDPCRDLDRLSRLDHKITNYYASIQNEDVELFQSCTVEKYMESLYENAYGGLLDDNAYVTQQKESYEKQLSGDIHFSQILVNDCLKQDETGSNAEYLTGMLNELNEDSNYCTDHMESCKTLTVQPVLTNGTDTVYCDEVTVFLIELDNQYYVCA